MVILIKMIRKLANHPCRDLKTSARTTTKTRIKRSGKRSSKKRPERFKTYFFRNSTS